MELSVWTYILFNNNFDLKHLFYMFENLEYDYIVNKRLKIL